MWAISACTQPLQPLLCLYVASLALPDPLRKGAYRLEIVISIYKRLCEERGEECLPMRDWLVAKHRKALLHCKKAWNSL